MDFIKPFVWDTNEKCKEPFSVSASLEVNPDKLLRNVAVVQYYDAVVTDDEPVFSPARNIELRFERDLVSIEPRAFSKWLTLCMKNIWAANTLLDEKEAWYLTAQLYYNEFDEKRILSSLVPTGNPNDFYGRIYHGCYKNVYHLYLDPMRGCYEVKESLSSKEILTKDSENLSSSFEQSKVVTENAGNVAPTPEEVVDKLLKLKLIDQREADLYMSNYAYFEKHREEIESKYGSMWVASVNNEIISAENLNLLDVELGKITDSERAYIEYVQGD